jgi:nucleoside-diphosphate-sugar epimerase
LNLIMPPSNILVIGGSGFLSGAIVRAALASGHHVWTLTRGQRPLPEGAISLVADRADQAAFAEVIRSAWTQWDMVVDCIGFTPADVEQDLAVLSPLARHLVFVSTDFVYDPARRRFPQSEDSDHFLADGYGGQKRRCELTLMSADAGAMAWTIVRPCHIYGPGSQLGCLPLHGRDPQLIARLRAGEPLRLVGGGHFLQQPIFADDLAQTILSMQGNVATHGQIFCAAGPDIVESREYYRIVANILDVGLEVEEVPVAPYQRDHPEAAPFLCHRIYDLRKLQSSGAAVPATPLKQGLRAHVASSLD